MVNILFCLSIKQQPKTKTQQRNRIAEKLKSSDSFMHSVNTKQRRKEKSTTRSLHQTHTHTHIKQFRNAFQFKIEWKI